MKRFLLCICILGAAGCPGPADNGPEANFTASPAEGEAPLTVEFSDTSTAGTADIVAWRWDFGDGVTSEEQDPAYTYVDPGLYTVTLEVTDSDGETDSVSKVDFIAATERPLSIMTNRLEGAAPLSIVFEESVSTALPAVENRAWDFGDPNSGDNNASSDARVLHEYVEPGVYTAVLSIETVGGDLYETAVEITVFETERVVLTENAVVPELELSVDFLEMTEFTLTFALVGSDPHPFEVGDIVVGSEGGGYLRNVAIITEESDRVILDTFPATLGDVIAEGEYEFSGEFTAEDFAKAGFKTIQKDTLVLIDLSGAVLVEVEDLFKAVLEKAELRMEPSFKMHAGWFFGVKSLGAELTGLITGEMIVKATAMGEVKLPTTKKQIGNTISRPFLVNIGPVPVLARAELALNVWIDANIKGESEIRSGYRVTIPSRLGLAYERGADPQWTPVAEFPIETVPIAGDPETNIDVAVRVSLGPELTIKVYEVLAPSIAIKPYLQGRITVVPHPSVFRLEAGVDAEVGFEVGIFRNEEDDSLLVDESIPIEGPSFEILRYTGSDLNVSADFIGLTSTSPSITLTVENIAPGLPINPPTAKVLVERFEPLRWRATASDPRIIVTPDSAMGNGSMSGDSTQVTISIDPEDAASLSGEIALGVTFHNEDDLLGRDEEFLIVNVRELDPLLPLESVLGVWENNSDPDGIVGTFLTMTFESDGSWRYVFNSVREIEDVVQPPELIWDVSGTFRQEVDADIFCCIDNNRFLLAEWALWIESITDCIGSGTPEQREHFCGEVRSGLVFGSLLTTSRFYREATDRLGFLNEDNVFTRSAR